MPGLRHFALAGAAFGVAAASSSDTSSNLPNVVGNWVVYQLQFVSAANSSTKSDLPSGTSAALAITATAFTISSQGSTLLTGTYTETATTLVFTGMDAGGHAETLTFALGLSGSTLSLTGATTTHNFGSGEVPAVLNIAGTKQ